MQLAIQKPDPIHAAQILLGGKKLLGREATNPIEVHDILAEGLPGQSLSVLRSHLGRDWTDGMVAQALGVTSRTLQRRKDGKDGRVEKLSAEMGSRAWKFAEILTFATRVFGDQKAAEDWLRRPAPVLEGRAPLSLLATTAGSEAVMTYLGQIEYGIYI
jgi:putative toxin-antitoxin system antitoxin component (TIGR02293 family)